MELKVKIYLSDDSGEKFMGIGVIWLLEEVGRAGSLRKASINLGISYTKCYNMVKRAEENLGRELIDRKKGGASHEGATLTDFAREFISLYWDFQKRAKEKVEEEFVIFGKDLEGLKRRFEEDAV